MRVAEGKAGALTWDINQAKEAMKVRVKTEQDKTEQHKT
jgi:hypothetical protein